MDLQKHQQSLVEIAFELNAWLEEMSNYSDKQYGKHKIQELRDKCYLDTLALMPGADGLQFQTTPSKRWSWNHRKEDFVQAVTVRKNNLSEPTSLTFALDSDGTAHCDFDKPCVGILFLKRR